MNPEREAFLAGERPDDVHIFLSSDSVSKIDALEAHGERVEDGIALVMDGEQARTTFQRTTGIDPMGLAQEAMGSEGDVSSDCTDGTCPAGTGEKHTPQFIFAFAEEQNEAVGGLYAEGDVIHAYVACACGERYSHKWVAGT